MKMTDAIKTQIDGMTYEDLLRRWRYAVVGDPIFQGDVGKYYSDRMFTLRDGDPAAAVAASKRIGWNGR